MISKFQNISVDNSPYIGNVNLAKPGTPAVQGITIVLNPEDFYLKNPKKNKIDFSILFSKEEIEKLAPNLLAKQEKFLRESSLDQSFVKQEITMINIDTLLRGKYFSPFIHSDIIEEIKRSILSCPEARLKTYRDKDLSRYKEDMKLRSSQRRRWIDFLKQIVDPKIDDERYENIVRLINGEEFEDALQNQGSGVRSLSCLALDILFSDAKVILIDEPELGLNPFVKQEFMKFLLQLSEERQIFIATHDPTFVNPIIYRKLANVYVYSPINGGFIQVDLTAGDKDPATFAGFMTHTSLKNVHLYVEGPSDVYIFQVLLMKYLKLILLEKKHWIEAWNRVGIYHLAGDFWRHLIYTVPKYPYKSLVILDSDKKKDALEVSMKYNKSDFSATKFSVYDRPNLTSAIQDAINGNRVIYCLEKDCIEDYLDLKHDLNNPYNKRRDGPKIAEEMSQIPEEIKDIFEAFIKYELSNS